MTRETSTLDRLYLEWSRFTRAKTWRDVIYEGALEAIAKSNPNKFEDPEAHANWCKDRAEQALAAGRAPAPPQDSGNR